ncbi:MAG: GFA family protein, partial [bacterium]
MNESLTGGCSCRSVRYEITKQPMFVHCCHCHLCQQQTGSAFITHVFIETEHIEFSSGT